MRQFARICHGFNVIDRSDIADTLEETLNAEVSIAGPTKSPTFKVSTLSADDYQTVHPNVIAKPQFPFLPASYKLQRITSYHALKDELDKVKQLKNTLTSLARHDGALKERIQGSIKEYSELVEMLDADSNLFSTDALVGNNPAIQRFKKTSSVLNELIGSIFREGLAIEGIDYDNIEQVYNPLITGLGSLHATHEYLLTHGISAETSQMLCRKYLNQLANSDNH